MKTNKKILLTATVQSHIAQFHNPLIKILKEHEYEIHVAAKDNLAEKNGLKLANIDKIFDIPFARSPKSKDNYNAYKELKKIINSNHYDLIHCNTPMGGVITRLAAKDERKKGTKVIYTAHGFHFYKGASLFNWIIYYPIEKILAKYTDKLITINREDFDIANRKFNTKVYYIHGVGANSNKYNHEKININIRNKLNFGENDFLVLCTGELNENKNQQTVIKAFAEINNKKIKLLIAGNGPLKTKLQTLCEQLNVSDRVFFLGYRTDLEDYAKISDIIISMSIREGLGQNVLEGMLCGKPIIASDNRGHNDLVKDRVGGYLVGAHDYAKLAERIYYLYSNINIRKQMGEYNQQKSQVFTDLNVRKELEKIYEFK